MAHNDIKKTLSMRTKRKVTGWLDGTSMQVAEVNGAPKPCSSDCRLEVTSDKTHLCEKRGKIRATHPI